MRHLAALLAAVLAAASIPLALALAVVAPPAHAWENGLARTPPMGWNQWNAFGCNVTDALVRATADRFVATGLRDAGYSYVNIDDCWMTRNRDAAGNLVPDPVKFPAGIRAVADYVHARGLKLGIYSSAGTQTCAGFPASLNNEQRDANLFASWGVDYLKYDNCNNQGVPAQTRYTRMRDAIIATGRPMVYSITEWGQNQPWNWAQPVGNLWRTTGDITDSYGSMLSIYRINVPLAQFAAPGAWNDPDMLEVGNGGMTDTEYRTHFTLWSMMAAPLLIGTDLRTASPSTLAILGNRDVIAIDQDARGVQAREVRSAGGLHVLSRPLAGGDFAVALFNETGSTATITTNPAETGLPGATSYRLFDVWSKAVSTTTGTISASVPAHGTVAFRVTPGTQAGPPPGTSFVSDLPWQASTNGWGPAERDRSNGEQPAGDGRPLSIGGVGYAKGIGAHAASTIDVFLAGRCSTFTADVGVDAETGTNGTVTFSVLGDGTTLTSTGIRRGGQAAQRISVDITGRTTLRLTVGNGGDNINFDHADWANPQITCST
ncbi:MAG TPA: NPCBM/NEW2 domain-containing protein [Actinophytocola sp.]|uniref:NPCBM/NEW2 domain-containing protein n=1 Tax=Actinophytocola sp. TaxID=1872138 RepID=UPI002DBE7726|nr:NPCBM/NEW2 domain-containing protein [Actinophytocola sp.]HEU5471595.1 NPCBM/NEW2 domain-containing protein [Actinophytocola sp.]